VNPPTDIVIGIRITREFPVEEMVGTCWESLYTHTHNFRPIVVDDSSDEQGARFIEGLIKGRRDIILIRTHFQHWYTRAFNLGLRMVRTPTVVLLNCDTVLDTGWMEELYAVKDEVAQQGRVGLVGSTMSLEEPRRYEVCRHPGYVTAHCWLADMQALFEASASRGMPGIYLDETNPLMIHIRSDVEMSYKMMELGWLCVSSFKSLVGHAGGRTWGYQLGAIPHSLEMVSYRY